tara:strand:- start:510 stop:707 length:198 start_codon:yes stop_codon:yes gene_type:complete
MTRIEKDAKKAAEMAAKSEMLLEHSTGYLEAEGMEKTYKFRQEEIRENVDEQSALKSFSLTLDEV